VRLSLKQRIIGLSALAALLPIAVTFFWIMAQRERLSSAMIEEMNEISAAQGKEITTVVYRMCSMSRFHTERRLRDHLFGARDLVERQGKVTLSDERVEWKAVNQSTGESSIVSLPLMLMGTDSMRFNDDPAVESPVVDEVTRLTKAFCTIFQRVNTAGDMIRVATTVVGENKKRAVGTFIPHRLPDGQENPMVATVLKGHTYVGRAIVMKQWHLAAYEPIFDSEQKKEVIGALYVGFSMEEMSRELRDALKTIAIGKSGYIYILGGSGEQRGRYILSKGGADDGRNIWDSKDDAGRAFIQEIVRGALRTSNGSVCYERYPWKNQGEQAARMKTATVTYFEPWDWVIASSMYEDDYHDVVEQFTRSIWSLLTNSAASGAAVAIVVVLLAVWLGSLIARPVTRMTGVAQVIAAGDLGLARDTIDQMRKEWKLDSSEAGREAESSCRDETVQLLSVVHAMTQSLTSLVGQVQRAAVQVVSTATQIGSAARVQESTVNDLGASTTEIAAAVREISATSQELASTMQSVQKTAAETAALADTGRFGLTGMESSMKQLAQATASISDRLAVINEKAGNINSMVTTIGKVADQTNLLSLNAAIEAEKAGEFGLGFSVVAREIRRLADQTGVSSLEIEETVREMQTSVASGVMEMDKFTGEVTQSVRAVSEISAQLASIIEQVKDLMSRFDSVNDGMRAQSAGAGQISDAMAQLSEGARNSLDSVKQFNDATDQLKEAARNMQKEAARFKV